MVSASEPVTVAENNFSHFNQIATDVETHIGSNLKLALKNLLLFENKLEHLTLKQQILYYKLLAEIQLEQAKYQLSKETSDIGLTLTKELTSPSILIAKLLYIRGFSIESLGDFDNAFKDYENGLEVAKSLQDNVFIAYGLINMGAIYYLTDRYERSLTVLNDAYNIAKQTNDEELKGSINSELGILYATLNQTEQALVYYRQSYQHYKNSGKTSLAHNSLLNIALTHLNTKQYELAIKEYKTIIKEFDGNTQNEMFYNVYSGISWAYLVMHEPNPELAYEYLMQSKQYVNNLEQHDLKWQHNELQAEILFELKHYEKALLSLEKVQAALAKYQYTTHLQQKAIVNASLLKSTILYELGKYQQAYLVRSAALILAIELRKSESISAVAEIGFKLKSDQANLHKKTLQNKQALQNRALIDAQLAHEQHRYYLFFSILVALIFAWLLIKLVQGQKRLKAYTNTDILTGIPNRRSLMKTGIIKFSRAKQKNEDFSVLVIDVDHFKKINDRLGHQVGDEVLKKIADLGSNMMRKTDVFGRFGGEEFVVFLPHTDIEQATIIAERFRLSVNEYSWNIDLLDNVHVSIGVAMYEKLAITNKLKMPLHEEFTDLFNLADERLYQAKKQGKNRVCYS